MPSKISFIPANGCRRETFHVFEDLQVIKVGTLSSAQFQLRSSSVSRMHACLQYRRGDGWYVSDLGSASGTKVNGHRIHKCKLRRGDTVGFGDTTFRVSMDAADDPDNPREKVSQELGELKRRLGITTSPGGMVINGDVSGSDLAQIKEALGGGEPVVVNGNVTGVDFSDELRVTLTADQVAEHDRKVRKLELQVKELEAEVESLRRKNKVLQDRNLECEDKAEGTQDNEFASSWASRDQENIW